MKRAYEEYMPCTYTTGKDLEQRLYKTICRYDGVPVYVASTAGNGEVILAHFPEYSKIFKEIKADDPLFDISIMETGYFNYTGKSGDNVYFAKKNPDKQWKGALTNVKFYDIKGNPAKMYEGMFTEGFAKSLRGEFPPIIESLSSVSTGDVKAVAISQDVAFSKTEVGVTFIYYRTKPVGWVAPNETKVNVTDAGYAWVIQRLLSRSGLYI